MILRLKKRKNIPGDTVTDTEERGKREKSVCDIVTFPHWEAGETRRENLCNTGTVRESIISSRYSRSFKQI